MAEETELKLALRPTDLARLLAHPLLRSPVLPAQRLFNTYFDTPDLALMKERIAVRERRVGRRTLLTVKTAGRSAGGLSRRGEWEAPTRAGAPDFLALVDDAELAQRLLAWAPRLRPVFSTDFQRQTWLLNHAGAQIELALDRGQIRANGRSEDLLELELELKSGPPDALFTLALTLALGPQGDAAPGLWLCPSERSKAERGLALYRNQAVAAPDAPELANAMDARSAFCRIAAQQLARLQAELIALQSGPADGDDPEPLHQVRVALRRLRSALGLFAAHLPRRFVAHWRQAWKDSAHELDAARDHDVFALDTLPLLLQGDSGFAPLRAWADALRLAHHRRAIERLREPALGLRVLAFSRALHGLQQGQSGHGGRPGALRAWARALLRRRHHSLLKHLQRSDDRGAALHALRIRLKQQRYAQEFVSALLPPHAHSAALHKRAQDQLGALNDLRFAKSLLRQAPGAQPPDLSQRLEDERRSRLARLPELRRALAAARTPWD
jgi:inorganic triphosphatase YgiF